MRNGHAARMHWALLPLLPLLPLLAAVLVGCGGNDTPTPSAEAPSDAGADGTPSGDAVVDETDAADAAAPHLGLFTRADDAPTTSTHLVALDLASGARAGELVQAGVASVHASGGRAFLLDRDSDRFVALDRARPWTAAWTHAAASADAPVATAIVATAEHAYVLRQGSNSIEILALADGAHVGDVDLSRFVDPLDSDGLVDASDGVYDASAGRVYVVLPRNRPRDPRQRCTPSGALLVGIDVTTRAVVDLNGAADGEGIALAGQWPAPPGGGAFFDGAAKVVQLIDAGCYGDAGLTGAGIERVDLAAGTSSLLVASDVGVPLSTLLRVDPGHAFVRTVSPAPAWRAWDPASASVGAIESGLPAIAAVDGRRVRVVGVTERANGMGTTLDVVAFDPALRKLAFVAEDALRGAHLASAAVVVP